MRTTMLILIAAGALLLAGCFGYGHGWSGHGPHMSWEEHDAHMRGYPGRGYPPPPCDPDAPAGGNGTPCRTDR